MNGRAKLRVKFFEYLVSREYTLLPDVVKYDESTMNKLQFDLILGTNTMKELGSVLYFWTKEFTLDEISLPMRNINKVGASFVLVTPIFFTPFLCRAAFPAYPTQFFFVHIFP